MTNEAAAAIGRLARGVKKTMTKAAIAQRKRAGFKKGNKAAMKKSNQQISGPKPEEQNHE